jgi:hypothetical protein
MPAMMKSIRQPSLKPFTNVRENPAAHEKQYTRQNISNVCHGSITSTLQK